ncbi:MAG TPA: CBS domain-containing protein [Chitinophagales bacterium]|nr:CBS domain-containing protein [Chitinophagales bacterium]
MQISASIYSNKEKNLAILVRELDAHGIDMLHIDCFDANVFEDIAAIRSISNTPVDLHIIDTQPGKYFEYINRLKIEYVSIQYGKDVIIPALPVNGITQWGLALTSHDNLDVFETTAANFDYVLIMASEPGKSGLPFNKDNFQRIIDFKKRFPKKKVQVDGGINDRIAFILRLLGVNSIVSGNYLLNRDYLGVGMLNLHKTPISGEVLSDFRVEDFMTPAKYLPVLNAPTLDLKTTLQAIENYGMGFALIKGAGGQLQGVISNADVRRAFLNNIDDLNKTSVASMINTRPITINKNATLADMLHLLNNLNFIVLFLPVIGENNSLEGAVLLNNLTRV